MNDRTLMIATLAVSVLIAPALITLHEYRDKFRHNGDEPLTNKQVLDKGQKCADAGKAIKLVYDDEWKVYAVKCVEGGFDGEGNKK